MKYYITVLMLLLCSCRKDINITSPGYTIGTVVAYTRPSNGNPSTIEFIYIVGSQTLSTLYKNKDNGWSVPTQGGVDQGQQYMVQYDANNASIARMLFDYPVYDSMDFRRDTAYFAIHNP